MKREDTFRKSFTRNLPRVELCLLGLALSASFLTGVVGAAFAQGFPNKPIRFIVAQPPNGSADLVARLIGQKLAANWGQQVVIDNRPGASGIIGADTAAKAPPDGYTIFLGFGGLAIQESLKKKLPYSLERDLAPVSLVTEQTFLLAVPPSMPVTSVKELITLAKSKPGQLTYGSFGIGTLPHLSMLMFAAKTGIEAVHVPYKGSIPALADLMGDRLSMMIIDMPPSLPLVKAGKIRALAVTTAKRSSSMPDLPTVAEAGVPGYTGPRSWFGVFVPARTPTEIITKYNVELGNISRMQDVRNLLSSWGSEAVVSTPEDLGALVKSDVAMWATVIRGAGIQID